MRGHRDAWRKGGPSQQGPEPDSVNSPRGAPAAYPPYMDSKPLCRFRAVLVPLETKTSGQSATKPLPTSIIATDNSSAAVVLATIRPSLAFASFSAAAWLLTLASITTGHPLASSMGISGRPLLSRSGGGQGRGSPDQRGAFPQAPRLRPVRLRALESEGRTRVVLSLLAIWSLKEEARGKAN